MAHKTSIRGRQVPPALRAAATALIEELGGDDKQAAKAIGIGRNTLSRALAGLPVLNGNVALLEIYFPEAVEK